MCVLWSRKLKRISLISFELNLKSIKSPIKPSMLKMHLCCSIHHHHHNHRHYQLIWLLICFRAHWWTQYTHIYIHNNLNQMTLCTENNVAHFLIIARWNYIDIYIYIEFSKSEQLLLVAYSSKCYVWKTLGRRQSSTTIQICYIQTNSNARSKWSG